ncbi:MAG: hypothetical protein HRT71_03815 [Flavobacteriales bacterium]|nr:hypothetical protein [Flavobacteriales bacterium]
MEFLKDLWMFTKERKKFWLAPIVIVLVFIGLLAIFASSGSAGAFIYTLF